MANNDLFVRMNEKLSSMSKGQKKIANYITLNYETAAFLTAAKIGRIVGVSESTVVRFAMLLGYKGYPEFQQTMETLVREKLNTLETIEVASSQMTKTQVLETVLQSDARKIRLTLESMDKEAFEQAVDILNYARKIYIIGIRNCAPLAAFLEFYLKLIFEEVILVSSNSASEIFEQMYRINEQDCIIGISFPRYSMRTLKAMEFANNRNAKVITITDSKNSPMNLYSSCNLLAKSEMASIVDSLVAPLSVINALIVSLCIKQQDKVVQNLKELEDIWNEYQIDESDEIDKADDKVEMKRW